ncbi:mycophenolic acid acyl-glucuronide esterase, mitochondrial-like [Morone saxatilis]|uniref:mycophenolic acid acyl-glucuronide esterase, mitochondrial-like n=1 Tax=Morone saxatilis TaxID=34816 RepID=UPI0015E1EC4D|nr:mycophenolic acid acyl-glucuronide esterase, mitochondrial-like [Morone saxatilis]
MAAVALRSCRRGLSHILSNGGLAALSSKRLEGDRRHKSTVQYASRPDLPKLAYRRVKGKSPGVVFLPGYGSNMNGQKAESLEEFCRSLGHSYLRFDYTGHGASEGVLAEGTIGTWKKDVLFVLDELAEGPQVNITYGHVPLQVTGG